MGTGNSSQDWKNDYDLVQISDISPHKKIVSPKMRRDRFEMLSLHLSDQLQIKRMTNRLRDRDTTRSPYLVPFERVYHKTIQNMCGNSVKFDLIYENSETTLSDHYYHRLNKQQRFSIEQVMYITKNICYALRDLKKMQDGHGIITMKSIVTTSEVLLSDPITEQILREEQAQYKKSKIQGYPSPAVLLNRIDSGMNIDRFKEDLFSIGVIALQLLNMDIDIKTIYKSKNQTYSNAKVDYDIIYSKIDKIRAEPLKQWIQTLVQPNSEQRLYVYKIMEGINVPRYLIKVLREEPQQMSPQQQLVQQNRPLSYEESIQYPRPQLQAHHYSSSPPKMVESEYITHVKPTPVNKNIRFNPPSSNEPVRPPSVEPFRHTVLETQSIHFTANNFRPEPRVQPYYQKQVPVQYRPLPSPPQYEPRPLMEPQPLRYNYHTTNQPQVSFNGQRRQYSPFIRKQYEVTQQTPRFVSVQKQKPSSAISFSAFASNIPRKQFEYKSAVQYAKIDSKDSNHILSYFEGSLDSPQMPYRSEYNPQKEPLIHAVKQQNYVEASNAQATVGVPTDSNNQRNKEFDQQLNRAGNKQKEKQSPLFRKTSSDFVTYELSSPDMKGKIDKTHVRSKESLENVVKQKEIKHNSSSKSIERRRQIQQQIAQLQRITKQNQRLENILKNGQSLEPVNPNPVPQQIIVQAQNQDSKVQDASFVIQSYEDGSKYEGFVQDKKRNGYGKFYYQGGSVYDGQWKNNHMNGYGTLFYPQGSIVYQGNWRNDEFHGKGTLFNANIQQIKGYFDYTDFTNMEEDQWQNYEGYFSDGQRHGKGKLTLSNGETFDGIFSEGMPEGMGVFTRSRGAKVKGVWSKGRLSTIME